MRRPIISLITDFGSSDHYAGTMKGVILGICPDAQIVDITHEIFNYAIAEAAFTLGQAWAYYPRGTVHLIVVDPGVGSRRRPLLAEAGGHCFIAPDNGVLTIALEAAGECKVREITASRYFRKPMSQTFHGRDIFAPVAAHVAKGVAPARFGKRIEDYIRLPLARPVQTGPGQWEGAILKIDHYGNAVTNFRTESWSGHLAAGPFQITIRGHRVAVVASSYAEMKAEDLFVIGGSAGFLEISIREGSAAALTGCALGDTVELRLG